MSSSVAEFFSPEEVQAIRSYYAREVAPNQRLTPEEVDRGLLVAASRRLKPPPLGNHIYFLKRQAREQGEDGSWRDVQKLSIQTGIDGYRLIAERTGKYLGSSVPQYEHDANGFLRRATIVVYKLGPDGQRVEVGADAWFDEYAQWTQKKDGRVLTKMWNEKGHLMLSKCSESIALRKAHPEELSGIYTVEEMGGEDGQRVPEAEVPPPPRPQATAQTQAPAAAPAQPQLADRERKRKFEGAINAACAGYGTKREAMLALLLRWAPRPAGSAPAVNEAGVFAPDVSAAELEAMIAQFKAWDAAEREAARAGAARAPAGQPPAAAPPRPPEPTAAEREAEAARREWEAAAAKTRAAPPIDEDDIPF